MNDVKEKCAEDYTDFLVKKVKSGSGSRSDWIQFQIRPGKKVPDPIKSGSTALTIPVTARINQSTHEIPYRNQSNQSVMRIYWGSAFSLGSGFQTRINFLTGLRNQIYNVVNFCTSTHIPKHNILILEHGWFMLKCANFEETIA